MDEIAASFPARLHATSEPARLVLEGAWTAAGMRAEALIAAAAQALSALPEGPVALEAAAQAEVDTVGALVLEHIAAEAGRRGRSLDFSGLPSNWQATLALVERAGEHTPPPAPEPFSGFAYIGKVAVDLARHYRDMLAFIGEVTLHLLPLLVRPWRIRWDSVIVEIEAAGVRAIPIVALLSFLIGVVLAYQAGVTLDRFGANVFIADMIGVVVMREMGPMIAAILVAGRTGSSYAAQLGSMRVTQEIDALRSLALPPVEMLVIPRFLALAITLPLLTTLANAAGVLGGMVVATGGFGLDWTVGLQRLGRLENTHYWVGLVKTPVFATVIALIGCQAGMSVRGSALEVGRATTSSVVQAIFWVIVLDAIFSIAFRRLGL
ncbi:MAG: ABC transporter permease [Tepidiphilus sp.]|nr:ABC transporter permease [Tepidiphilus sp.]